MAGVEKVDRQPIALSIVALLFLIGGLMSAVQPMQMPVIGLGIINCLIGIGLWRRKPLARSWALIGLCFAMAFLILLAGMMLLPTTKPFIGIYLWQWQNVPKFVGIAFAIGLLGLSYWQYRVLRRDDVRTLFEQKPQSAHVNTSLDM